MLDENEINDIIDDNPIEEEEEEDEDSDEGPGGRKRKHGKNIFPLSCSRSKKANHLILLIIVITFQPFGTPKLSKKSIFQLICV